MPVAPMTGEMPDIDIIIPVYKNLAVTRACIESVLASGLPEGARIVVIEDASPEFDVQEYCKFLALQGRVHVIHHAANQGFVASVNEGMQLNTKRDVVLLNSDTEVANNWLQRLQAAAYSSANVATVTPFSNNASICSYPNFCQSNSLPTDLALAELDQVFARVNVGQRLLLPTAVGFCMFIRRDSLATLGYFDTEAFGRGYGEENDFCLRASSQGWQNLLAADVFVYHHGSVSFGEDRHPLMRAAEARLALRYPEYSQSVTEFIKHDSVLPFRSAVTDEIRRMALEEFLNTDKPRLLFITHSWGGGVEQHITDLLKSLQDKAHVMILRGMGRGRLEVQLAGLTRQWQSWTCGDFEGQFDQWLNALQALDFARVHLHHVHGWSPAVLKLISGLNLPFDVTLHDYYCVSRCYHLSPLAEYDRAQVQEAQAAAEDQWPATDAEWQNQFLLFLQNAARVIAPSQDVAQRVGAVFPEVAIQVQRHPEESFASPSIIKVALLGALSPAKGLELLRRVAASALANKAPVSFRIIGHSAEPLPEQISTTGSYAPHELSELIALERPDVIWLPSQVHETFGYTLSAALASGKPIVASAVGAFVERLRGIPQAQILPADANEIEWLSALTSAASQHVKPAEYSPRSLIDYSQFYNQPFVDQNPPKKLADAEALLGVLRLAPVAAPDPAKPILNLFRVGVYGGHKGAIEEVERRLARLPGGEIDVVGQLFADQLQNKQVAQSEQIHQLEDGLRQYQESFSASQQALDAAQDGLRQYREAFGALQIEHAELHSALRRLSIVQTERDIARQQVIDIVASTSWKITRPLRLIKIGGVAATLVMEDAGLEFRATKDLDVVLVVEILDAPFVKHVWEFIEAGRYEIRQVTDEKPRRYRFAKPANTDYPFMLELFSRQPDGVELGEDATLTPLPVDEAVSSLSAILMDDEAYDFLLEGRIEIDGIRLIGADRLIPLKASAWLDLRARAAKGEDVDAKNIRKHLNDVFRLSQLLGGETSITLPSGMTSQFVTFLVQARDETIDLKALKIPGGQAEILSRLATAYNVSNVST